MIEKLKTPPTVPNKKLFSVGLPAVPEEPGAPSFRISEKGVIFQAESTEGAVDSNELSPNIRKHLDVLLASKKESYTRTEVLWALKQKKFSVSDYELIVEIAEKHGLDKPARNKSWQWSKEALTELVETSWRNKGAGKEGAGEGKRFFFEGSTKKAYSFMDIAKELGYAVANSSLTEKMRGAAQELGIVVEEGKKARFTIEQARQICEALGPNPGSTRKGRLPGKT